MTAAHVAEIALFDTEPANLDDHRVSEWVPMPGPVQPYEPGLVLHYAIRRGESIVLTGRVGHLLEEGDQVCFPANWETYSLA